jgi:hypothetical protein
MYLILTLSSRYWTGTGDAARALEEVTSTGEVARAREEARKRSISRSGRISGDGARGRAPVEAFFVAGDPARVSEEGFSKCFCMLYCQVFCKACAKFSSLEESSCFLSNLSEISGDNDRGRNCGLGSAPEFKRQDAKFFPNSFDPATVK